MARADHSEVAEVERGHIGHAETFGESHHRGVSSAERQVGVLLYQVGCTSKVDSAEVSHGQEARIEGAKERSLLPVTPVSGEQIADLRDD